MKLRTLGPIGLRTFVFLLAAPWNRVCAEIPAALVRHAPAISGTVEGSVRQMLAESVTLNGEAAITEDLLLPGTPSVRLNGHPSFGGTVPGSGAASPANHVVTLSGNARLRFLRTRTDAVLLPGVTAPAGPTGTRSVALKNAGQSAGDFATLRNLTLDDKVGQVAVPPGVYGDFTAEGKNGFVLGVAGATQPAIYAFQRLTLNGEAPLQVAGPVVVTVANGFSAKGEFGSALHPAWLTLNLYSGGVKLEGDGTIYGYINAPNGAVTIDGKSLLVGGVTCDQLTINGEGRLRVLANTVNQPPLVSLTSPVNGATFVAPAAFTLTAMAADADGSVAKVEFYQGATKLGEDASAPFEFAVTSLVAGPYAFSARAYDNFNAVGVSSPLNLTVTNPTLPPVVTLTVPADDTVFNAPAIILLSATASDPDGTISRVEFFQGATKLGEVSSPPFEFSWPNVPPGTYSLTAKACDNGGASTVSAARTVTVQVGLPYFTGFEVVDGYAPGAVAGQAGWMASAAAIVTDTFSYQGAQSIQLAANFPPAMAALRFPDYAGPTVVFVEFFAQPAAGVAPDSSVFARVEAAHVAFVQAGAKGELYVLNGNGVGAGVWQPTGFTVALTSGGQSSVWIRLTLREDFAAKRLDLFANGRLVACDLGFVDNGAPAFAQFRLKGHETISSAFDEFYAGFDNPLFVDADKDGLPDAWESANGLNPGVNDRNGDPDGDGRTNAQEYQAGTAPNDYYDGTLPELTSLVDANQQPGPGGLLAVRVTRADGSVLANAPLAFDAVFGGSQLSATPDGSSYAAHIDVRSDAQGIAHAYIRFIGPPVPIDAVQASARSGAQTATLTLAVLPPSVDTDGDGVPDGWETPAGSDPPGNDGPADTDGDGLANVMEDLLGGNPTQPASPDASDSLRLRVYLPGK